MRGPKLLLGRKPIDQILACNDIGGNVGNLIYLHAVLRTLSRDDVEIHMDDYKINRELYTPEDVDYINNTYDAYICPMADAFRDSFNLFLKRYAAFIRELKIPFYVIGVGMRASIEPDFTEQWSRDPYVKEFVKAVLEHSSKIGIRGELTGKYLQRLGFREEIDYTVIGCPSMYTFGKDLKIRKPVVNKDSLINVNYGTTMKRSVGSILYNNVLKQYPNSVYTGQLIRELKTVFLGYKGLPKAPSYYPNSLDHDLFQEDRVRYFVQAEDWIRYFKDFDLSIGGRLHGNVSAMLGGCPAIFIPSDARMRELTEYHHLYCVNADEIGPDTSLEDIVSGYDDGPMLACHERNFNHYIDFLNENGISHRYQDHDKADDSWLFEKPSDGSETGAVPPATFLDRESLLDRSADFAQSSKEYYFDFIETKKARLRMINASLKEERRDLRDEKKQVMDEREALKRENRKLRAELDRANGELNRKSVRIARKFANFVHRY